MSNDSINSSSPLINQSTQQVAQQLLQEQRLKEANDAWARIHNRAHRLFTCLKQGNGKTPNNFEIMSLAVVLAQMTFGTLGNNQIDFAINVLANHMLAFDIEEYRKEHPLGNTNPIILNAQGRPIPTHNNEDDLSDNALLPEQEERGYGITHP